ncbi:MAG TPA: hypothetical protein VGI21_06310 [Streptosporangiaceae bacterium]|jgi:hypothetical protein
MTGPQHGKPPWATSWGSEPAEDLLEQGRDRPEGPEPEPVHRPPRWSPGWAPRLGRTGKLTAKLVVAALAVGLLGGYLGGYQVGGAHARGLIPKPKPTSALALSSFGLAETGSQCTTALGPDVQVGVEVVNGTPESIRLGAITANFPQGGMKVAASTWGPCGTVQGASAAQNPLLPPGASTWLSVTATTPGECPAGLPVQYVASFDQGGQTYTVALPGYVDVGSVQLKGCPAASGLS